jgi:hypothetical protein
VCSYSRPIMTLEPNPSRPSLYKNSAAIRSIRSSSSSSSSLLTRASQHPPRRRGSSSKPPPPPPPITTTYLPALPAERNIALHLQEHANPSLRPLGLSTRRTVTCFCVRAASGSPPAYSSKATVRCSQSHLQSLCYP